jgi:hypothetical protein
VTESDDTTCATCRDDGCPSCREPLRAVRRHRAADAVARQIERLELERDDAARRAATAR